MTPLHESALPICQPGVANLSRRVRQAIRFLIAVSCVAVVFLYLFFPAWAHWATYSIPPLAVLFILLSGFEAVLRGWTRFRRRRRISGTYVEIKRARTRHALSRRLIGLALAIGLVDAALFDMQPVAIGLAALLLLATVSPSPVFACFACENPSDRMSRLQRQTYYSLLAAVHDHASRPIPVAMHRVDESSGSEPEGYHLVAFPSANELEDEMAFPGRDDWEDDFECDVPAGGVSAESHVQRVRTLPR